MNNATVFLGGGRITNALIAGLRLTSYRRPIVVYDRHPEKLRALKKQFHVVPEPDLHKAVSRASLLIIAVRPSSVRDLLAEIGSVSHPITAVSVAAGIPLAQLRRLGPPVRWARAMPSPSCRTGHGLTALTFPRGSSWTIRKEVIQFFQAVGQVIEIPESRFDAFTVTYSVSHGYHALATLADAAAKLGLDRKTALLAASHALGEGILSWRESDSSLDELLHEAATPGGIAATVTEAMRKAGHSRIVERALRAGFLRAQANAKQPGQKILRTRRKKRTPR